MKQLTIIPLLLCIVITGKAQTIDKSVIASAGGSYSGSAMMVDYTIGESVINSATAGAYTVTEGFHPISYDAVTPSATPVIKTTGGLHATAYPNPVTSILHVSIDQSTASPLTLQVTDVAGTTVKRISLDGQLHTDADVDLTELASGMYYILVNAGKENAQVMKVIRN